jgi:hypothetical protein
MDHKSEIDETVRKMVSDTFHRFSPVVGDDGVVRDICKRCSKEKMSCLIPESPHFTKCRGFV